MKINKVIIQCVPSLENIPNELLDNITELKAINDGWNHILFDNRSAMAWVDDNFPEYTYYFDKISDDYFVSKIDLFRYLFLFERGGVWIDAKTSITNKLDTIINENYFEDGLCIENRISVLMFGVGSPFLKNLLEVVKINIEEITKTERGYSSILRTTGNSAFFELIAATEPAIKVVGRGEIGHIPDIFANSGKNYRTELGINCDFTSPFLVSRDMYEIATIVTPYYNTPFPFFKDYVDSVNEMGVRVVIVNDGSDSTHTKHLHDLLGSNKDVKIIDLKTNSGHEIALKVAIENVETPYVIRVDSDDYLIDMINIPDNFEDFDAFILRKSSIEMDDYLRRGGSPNGSMYKTEIYKEILSDDAEVLHDLEQWVHEDIWNHFNLLYGAYNIMFVLNRRLVYRRNFHNNSMTEKKSGFPERKRWDTFLLWALHYKRFDYYRETQNRVLGYKEVNFA